MDEDELDYGPFEDEIPKRQEGGRKIQGSSTNVRYVLLSSLTSEGIFTRDTYHGMHHN